MRTGSLAGLLGMPCRVRDVRVGEVAGVFVDAGATRVIGLDIRSADGVRRFLPWIAAERSEGAVSVRSSLLLVDAGDSYSRLGARGITDARELAGLGVASDGLLVGDGVVSINGPVGTTPR